jgi:hypothetical protein
MKLFICWEPEDEYDPLKGLDVGEATIVSARDERHAAEVFVAGGDHYTTEQYEQGIKVRVLRLPGPNDVVRRKEFTVKRAITFEVSE